MVWGLKGPGNAITFRVKYSSPEYALKKGTPGAAAYDLKACGAVELHPGERRVVPTGVFLELPPFFHALVLPRSGNAAKAGLTVLNAPGLIDSDYRGEVGVILINHGNQTVQIQDQDRIAQLLVQPSLTFGEWEVVEDLGTTERGEKGFGSTGVAGSQS